MLNLIQLVLQVVIQKGPTYMPMFYNCLEPFENDHDILLVMTSRCPKLVDDLLQDLLCSRFRVEKLRETAIRGSTLLVLLLLPLSTLLLPQSTYHRIFISNNLYFYKI